MKSYAFCGKDGCRPLGTGKSHASRLGIVAAVGLAPRCRNHSADVRKVQAALNRFPAHEGGPNPQLVVDGICGPKTSAAIRKFQTKQFGASEADGIVDVGRLTDRRLGGPATTYSNLTAEMQSHIPRVKAIISIARSALAAAERFKQGDGGHSFGFGEASWNKLVKHFQVDKFPSWQAQIRWINSIYIGMETAIGYIPQGVIALADEPDGSSVGAYAFTFAGGYHLSERNKTWQGLPRGTVYLCARMQELNRDAFAYVLIHEFAHYVGPPGDSGNEIDDHAYKHKPPKYDHLLPWQRVHNADCYSQFAFETVGKPFDLNAQVT